LTAGGKALGIIRGDTLLLLGSCNAGKTALYYNLAFGSKPATLTSMKPMDTVMSLHSSKGNPETKEFKVVDFPGHPRLRGKASAFLKRARAIIFVVDSTSVAKDVIPICEYLFTVMTASAVASQSLPLLIACNKSDQASSIAAPKIKTMLETELSQLIDTSGSLEDTGDGNDGTAALTKSGKTFSFDTDAPCKVTFANCSALNADSLGDVEAFMTAAM